MAGRVKKSSSPGPFSWTLKMGGSASICSFDAVQEKGSHESLLLAPRLDRVRAPVLWKPHRFSVQERLPFAPRKDEVRFILLPLAWTACKSLFSGNHDHFSVQERGQG
jgi:hypothetical protein